MLVSDALKPNTSTFNTMATAEPISIFLCMVSVKSLQMIITCHKMILEGKVILSEDHLSLLR